MKSGSCESLCSRISGSTSAPFIALVVIIDDDPKPATEHLEESFMPELKWRGIGLYRCSVIDSECGPNSYEDKVKQFEDAVTSLQNETPPCLIVMMIRVVPVFAESFKGVVKELKERSDWAKIWVCLISTQGVLVIDDEIKTDVLDFSNNGIWVARYLVREILINYTRHLGINNYRRQIKGSPIVIFVREIPVVGLKPVSSQLAEALSMEPISFVHHRVGYLISQPDTISHLSELAKENGYDRENITNGCRIYLRNVLDYDLDASTADVVIIDTLNDIYVDIDGMMKIAEKKASATFVVDDASEETVDRIVETMVWMIKRRCHYTDGPYADYFYTLMSLHKEMNTLRMFAGNSIEDCSTDVEPNEDRFSPLSAAENGNVDAATTATRCVPGKVVDEDGRRCSGGGDQGDSKPAEEAVPGKG